MDDTCCLRLSRWTVGDKSRMGHGHRLLVVSKKVDRPDDGGFIIVCLEIRTATAALACVLFSLKMTRLRFTLKGAGELTQWLG